MQECEPTGAVCRPERENLMGTPSYIVGCLNVSHSLSSRKSVTFHRSNRGEYYKCPPMTSSLEVSYGNVPARSV